MNTRAVSTITIAFLTVAVLTPLAAAQLPDPFATWNGGPGTSVTLGGGGESPPIPADFFGPGSDPFQGTIDLVGAPIDPANTGDLDTLVQRLGDPVLPGDPPGTVGVVPIEIVALSLTSLAPITVTFNGGQSPESWDVDVDLSVVTPPLGVLTATKTHANGGTFDSVLTVQPRFTFTKVGGGGGPMVLDTGLQGINHNVLSVAGAPWVHSVDPGLNIIVQPGANFVPGVDELVHGDPTSQVAVPFTGIDPGDVVHTVCPPTPPTPPSSAIPTLSEWGLIILSLLLLTTGTIVFRSRRRLVIRG